MEDEPKDRIGRRIADIKNDIDLLSEAIKSYETYIGLTVGSTPKFEDRARYDVSKGSPDEQKYLAHLKLQRDIFRKLHSLIIVLEDELQGNQMEIESQLKRK